MRTEEVPLKGEASNVIRFIPSSTRCQQRCECLQSSKGKRNSTQISVLIQTNIREPIKKSFRDLRTHTFISPAPFLRMELENVLQYAKSVQQKEDMGLKQQWTHSEVSVKRSPERTPCSRSKVQQGQTQPNDSRFQESGQIQITDALMVQQKSSEVSSSSIYGVSKCQTYPGESGTTRKSMHYSEASKLLSLEVKQRCP